MTYRLLVLLALFIASPLARADGKPATYSDVHAIFVRNCLACHDAKEAEGDLVLETYESILAGGENGKVILPGKSAESLLVKQIERREKPFMPPPKKGDALRPEEIAVIRSWIDAGAPKPTAGEITALATTQPAPHVAPKTAPRRAVQAIAYEPKNKLIAIARSNEIEIRSAVNQALVRRLTGHRGNVNDVAFTADGSRLIAVAGQPARGGEVRVWNVADGSRVRTFDGHSDAIYSLAVSPDSKTLATGSYDQKIILWDLDSGKKRIGLEGHNGAVFALAFRNDGKVLASGSADRTVKLWDVATGKRLDTRPESLKDQMTLAFTPDGQKLLSGGADNRVRVWSVSPSAAEGTNPLLGAYFAHEGTILKLAISTDGKTLATSADDGTVKLWNLADMRQKLLLPSQPDWPSAIAFALDGKVLAVGRLDGSVAYYDVATGKPLPTPKPELTGLDPRGVERGHTARLRLTGKNLFAASGAKSTAPGVSARMLPDSTSDIAGTIELTVAADAPTGPIDLTLTSASGDTAAVKLVIDDLPQVESSAPNHMATAATTAPALPVTFGGKFSARSQVDFFAFDGRAGQTVVLDVAAKRVGSKASVVVWLIDAAGRTLAGGEDVDGDPILEAKLPADGRYYIRAMEQTGAASEEHFYRISAGEFRVVTGCFPLAVAPSQPTDIRLLGFNIDPETKPVRVTAPAGPEFDVPVDRVAFRVRRQPKVLVTSPAECVSDSSNHSPLTAQRISAPSGISGRVAPASNGKPSFDYYRFPAKVGQTWVVETQAARRGSPVDTRIAVLWPDGKPVQRLNLQAVRDSYLSFRGADANQLGTRLASWEEMDLNQFVYIGGEVVRLARMPQGPDSDLLFFGIDGKRRCYFDTSATAHALDDKAYIVEPHDPAEKLAPNGLPVFPLYYENDDDELRQTGADSKLAFTAPADGDYLVRVGDVRNFGGDRYVYRLVIREATPDFKVALVGVTPSIPAGSGRSFTVKVDRLDGYDGPVRVDIANAPAGFSVSTPIVVESGQTEAKGTIYAAADAKSSDEKAPACTATASATVGGRLIAKPATALGRLSVEKAPPVIVRLEPYTEGGAAVPSTIDVIPGQLTKAWLRVQRNGHKDRVTMNVENLPFGVIVADIGLNGVMIPEGQSERMIFLQCAPWVKPTLRPCYARVNEVGNPTSSPVPVRIVSSDSPR